MATQSPVDQQLQNQSAQLSQQFVAEEQKRKQQKGGGKSIMENHFPYCWLIVQDYDLISTVSGNFISAVNLVPITTMPSIAQSLKVRVSLWKDGTFVAHKDIVSVLETMKQGGDKEDIAMKEKQKQEQEKQERDEIHHKSFQQNEGHQQQSQEQQAHQNDHDDSNKNYWRTIQMLLNQERMNITAKNDENFDSLLHYLHEQDRVINEFKGQAQLIEHETQERLRRTQARGG